MLRADKYGIRIACYTQRSIGLTVLVLLAACRVLDAKRATIPAELTQILFQIEDSKGTKIGKEQDLLKANSAQFPLAANRDYTVIGVAKAGDESYSSAKKPTRP